MEGLRVYRSLWESVGCFWFFSFGWDDDDELRDGWGSDDDDGEFTKDDEEADAWWAEESFGYIWQDIGVNNWYIFCGGIDSLPCSLDDT